MCDKVKKIPPVQIAYLAPIGLGVLAPAPFFQGPTPLRGPFLLVQPPAHHLSALGLASLPCSLCRAGA